MGKQIKGKDQWYSVFPARNGKTDQRRRSMVFCVSSMKWGNRSKKKENEFK
jgi:hypothetical protein